MKKDFSSDNRDIDENIIKLVIARIDAQVSPNLKLSIGSMGSINKQEMIEHVKNKDPIGKQIIQAHLNFIKAQANGQLISALNSIE